jgi:hypothetical protein
MTATTQATRFTLRLWWRPFKLSLEACADCRFSEGMAKDAAVLCRPLTHPAPKVPLADALALLLLALDQQPWRFETAAPRWHARLCHEARLTLPEPQLVLAALQTLSGPGAVGGAQAPAAVCSAHRLDDALGVLEAWLDASD